MRRACWEKVLEADGRNRERVIKGVNERWSYIYIVCVCMCVLYMYVCNILYAYIYTIVKH